MPKNILLETDNFEKFLCNFQLFVCVCVVCVLCVCVVCGVCGVYGFFIIVFTKWGIK